VIKGWDDGVGTMKLGERYEYNPLKIRRLGISCIPNLHCLNLTLSPFLHSLCFSKHCRAIINIPWEHAYGASGHPGFQIPGKAALRFEIEVLAIQ